MRQLAAATAEGHHRGTSCRKYYGMLGSWCREHSALFRASAQKISAANWWTAAWERAGS